MKIKTLNLVAFGKFRDKTIEISDGLNLIFGRNEAGKTTVQHFIEGMFFGFYKPYSKQRRFNADYYRFKPRNSDRYFGSMIYEDDNGLEIRLERDFLKNRDGIRIFNNITGEDISNTYPYDSVTKQYLPLGYGDFNSVRYNNTVNVKQMASKSDASLAKEVNNQLVEMAGDSTAGFSVKKILDYIQTEREGIGSIGKSKSNYGKVTRELEELKRSLVESEKAYDQVLSNQNLIRQYKDRMDQAREKCEAFQLEADEEAHRKQQELALKLQTVEEEIAELQTWLEQTMLHEKADRKTFGELKVVESSAQALGIQLEDIENQLEMLAQEKEKNEAECGESNQDLLSFPQKEVEQDYFNYCQLLQKGTGNSAKKRTDIEEVPVSSLTMKKEGSDVSSISLFTLILGAVAGLLIAVLGFANPGQFLEFWLQVVVGFLGLILFGASVVFMILRNKARARLGNNAMTSQDETASEAVEGDMAALEEKRIAIRKKYGINDEEAYFRFVERYNQNFNAHESLMTSQERIQEQTTRLLEDRQRLEEEKCRYEDLIQRALKVANVESVDAYGLACEANDDIRMMQTQLEAKQRLFEELSEREVIAADAAKTFYYTDQDGETVQLQDAIDAFNHEKARLTGENQMILERMANPVSIREKIEMLQQQIEKYTSDLKACDMAEKYFSAYFRKVHYDSAPDLNSTIGRMIYAITGKYSEVQVSDQMKISVVDPESGSLLSMEQLSGGTVDQMYLALRFGVADLFDQSRVMPLLLDDPFVQYDDQRKAEAVKMLSQLAKEKQILLFTCTADEKRIMDKNGYAYVGIGL